MSQEQGARSSLKTACYRVVSAAHLTSITYYFTGNEVTSGFTKLEPGIGGETAQPCKGCHHPRAAHQDWRWQDEIGGLVFRPSCGMDKCSCFGFVPPA